MNKWLIAAVSLPWVLAMCASAPQTQGEGGVTPTGAAVASGATLAQTSVAQMRATNTTQLYLQTCAKCHGDRGQGGGAGTPSLLTADKFHPKWDQPFFEAIRDGVPEMGMEAYGATLDEESIWALVVHIRELQARALRVQYGSPQPDAQGVYSSQHHRFRIETVIDQGSGLSTPWGLDWLPDGSMLVTSRPGRMHLFRNGSLIEVNGIPRSLELGQGGLLDVAVHPEARTNGWVYLAFADPAADGSRRAMTKVVRGRVTQSGGTARWTGQETVWQSSPDQYTGAGVHFGSRIVFDRQGHVFIAVGDRGAMERSQDLTRPNAKVFRVRESGGAPQDNPFVERRVNGSAALPEIWSYGHRNIQGMVMDLQGNLWATEHGPRGGDELNLVQRGRNYGWPLIGFSMNYNDSPLHAPWPKPGMPQDMVQPVWRWTPSIGASGLDVVRGEAFPQWRGDLLAGGLVGANLDRIRVRDGAVVEREELLHGLGRVREVSVSRAGHVYLALNGPDKVIRLVPAP